MGQLELKFGSGKRKFEIKMDGIEEAIQYKILELCMFGIKEITEDQPIKEEIKDEPEMKEKDFSPIDLESGYQLFNEPLLETKEEPKINAAPVENVKTKPMIHPFSPKKSIQIKNGIKHYQLFYICSDCGKKGKHHITPGTPHINCHEPSCANIMMVRQATPRGILDHDEWGNYFIAGEFKRSMKDKEDEESYYKTH